MRTGLSMTHAAGARRVAPLAAFVAILAPTAMSVATQSKVMVGAACLLALLPLAAWGRANRRQVLAGLDRHPLTAWCLLWVLASAAGALVGLLRGNDAVLIAGQLAPSIAFAACFLAAAPMLSALPRARWPLLLACAGVVLGLGGLADEVRWIVGSIDEPLVRFIDKSALVCSLALVLVVGITLRERPFVGGAVAVALAAIVVLTFTRSYWLGVAVAIALLIPAFLAARFGSGPRGRPLPGRTRAIAAGCAVALVVASAVVLTQTRAGDVINDRIAGGPGAGLDLSRVVRQFESRAALEAIAAHPVAGIGAGGRYATLYLQGPDLLAYGRENFIHNAYLYLPLKYGALGLAAAAALLFGLVAALMNGWRTARRTRSSWDAAHAAAFAGLCVASLTAPNLLDPHYAGLAGVVARFAGDTARDTFAVRREGSPLRTPLATVLICCLLLGSGVSAGLAIGARAERDDREGTTEDPERGLTGLVAAQQRARGPFVAGSEIRAAGENSAAGVVLRFWQAVQFGAPTDVVTALFAPQAGVGAARLRREVRPIRYLFTRAKPQVVDVRREGPRTHVFTLVTSGGLDVDRRQPGEPVVFSVVRAAGQWKLADDAFVRAKYRAETAGSP